MDTATAPRPRAYGRKLRLSAVGQDDPQRPELESYVRSAFQRKHEARVHTFMPTLLSFRGAEGGLCGVVGLRPAADHRLYLEQYLDEPVETALGRATGCEVGRENVVEVGNLAGASCRAAMRMVAQLPTYLLSHEYRWIVFTATRAVRMILLGFNAPLVELGAADARRVQGGRDEWGSYYDTDPRVLAGYLPLSRTIAGFEQGGRAH